MMVILSAFTAWGSYPVQGFFELKQDLFDIENGV
jgi:hypothetical protein